jgi:mono/diheme cytochrome c family protein
MRRRHRQGKNRQDRLDPRAVGPAVLAGVCLAGLTLAAVGPQAAPQRAAQAPATESAAGSQRALFTKYCVSCHNETLKTRGTVPVAFDALDIADVTAAPEAWEGVVLKMRAGLMPPAGAPRPDKATSEAFVTRLEADLDRAAAANPNPGRTEPFHRLNRAEYRNAVRDLLDVDVDVSAMLPADDSSYGFDNIAGVLKISPTLMERYLAAAQKISRTAVGTAPAAPAIDYFRIADDLSQDVQLPGLPFGTRGGTRIAYTFPTDGEYEIRPRLTRDLNESLPVYADAQVLEISIDGERVGTFTLPGVQSAPASAGRGRGARPRAGGGRGAAAPPATGGRASQAPPAPAQPRPSDSPDDAPDPQVPAISQIAPTIRISARDRDARNRADEAWNLRVPVKAGRREVIVTFVNRTAALDETTRLPFLRPYPAGVNIPETRLGAYLRSVEIAVPFNPVGPGTSASRERIFTCRPAAAPAEAACAQSILSSLARRAYRRPVTPADVEPLLAFYREGRNEADFEAGIERALRRLLVSPEFLFRVVRDPAGTAPGASYRISDVDLASRLSFFLWSSIPDEELLDLAETRRLGEPAVLASQVRRMLADPRAEAFTANFAGQWLFLRNLDAVVPVQSLFPDFDDTLRQAFRRETELFFDSVVREDRSALDVLRADYTFLNERLAKHYGVPNVKGSHFRRVSLGPDSPRAGILGQGAVLTVTSYPDRTSPVVRGKWILENLLGTPPPPPLPNVGDLKPNDDTGAVLSMRERMEQHRRNPVCASCHSMMDPLGLSLENFDAVGKWRTLGESAAPIDASGRLPDGTLFEGPGGLREALLRSDRFVATLTEKLMTYALGRGLEYYDRPAVRAILRDAAQDEYRMSSLIAGIVQSTPFRMRRAM